MFLRAIKRHGIPLRVRGDRGGENRDVSILMILLRGANHSSFLWGSSVFNTRIERLWVEVGRRFARSWRAFFLHLERCHLLQRKNPSHRWLLHYLFLHEINVDCDKFHEEWNAHPLSGLGGGRSPNVSCICKFYRIDKLLMSGIQDLAFLGQLKHGVYAYDECEGLSEDEINAFYGFGDNGEPFQEEEEGFQSSDEEDSGGQDVGSSEGTDDEEDPDDEIEPEVGDSDSDGTEEVCMPFLFLL